MAFLDVRSHLKERYCSKCAEIRRTTDQCCKRSYHPSMKLSTTIKIPSAATAMEVITKSSPSAFALIAP